MAIRPIWTNHHNSDSPIYGRDLLAYIKNELHDGLISYDIYWALESEVINDKVIYCNFQCKNPVCLIRRSMLFSNNKALKDRNLFITKEHLKAGVEKGTEACSKNLYKLDPKCLTVMSDSLYEKIEPFLLPAGFRCIQCYLSKLMRCQACGEEVPTLNRVIYTPWFSVICCESCFQEKVTTCPSCDLYVFRSWIYDEHCWKCSPEVINEYTYKPLTRFFGEEEHSKFYGIELEVEMKLGLEKAINLIAGRFLEDVGETIYLKKDASLRNGFEIVTHPISYKLWHSDENRLFKGLSKLSANCDSFGRESCGTHVHVSTTAFGGNYHLANFVKFFYINQFLTAYVAERYQRFQSAFNTDIEHNIYNIFHQGYIPDRHTAINLFTNLNQPINKQRTVEVRVFKGNMKKERILKNIEFVDAVIEYTRNLTKVDDWYNSTLEDNREILSAQKFKQWVGEHIETYPYLGDFIKTYKKVS